MKSIITLKFGAVISGLFLFLLSSCEKEFYDEELPITPLTSAGQLVGVWEMESKPMFDYANASAHATDVSVIRFTDSTSQFFRYGDNLNDPYPSPDSVYFFEVGSPHSFVAREREIEFHGNPHLWLLLHPQRRPATGAVATRPYTIAEPHKIAHGVRYKAMTIQPEDSLQILAGRSSLIIDPVVDSLGDTTHWLQTSAVDSGPFIFRILGIGATRTKEGEKVDVLRLRSERCFVLEDDEANQRYCPELVFVRRNRPEFEEILANVDTLSLNDVCPNCRELLGRPILFNVVPWAMTY